MPIKRCFKNGVAGWKFGDEGRCYTGPGAKAKAAKQGRAIQARKHMGAPMAGDAIYNICCKNFQVILGDQLTEIDGTVFLGQCQNRIALGFATRTIRGQSLSM